MAAASALGAGNLLKAKADEPTTTVQAAQVSAQAVNPPYTKDELARQGIALKYLDARPFKPNIPNLFLKDAYPQGVEQPIPTKKPTEAEVKAEYREVLRKRPQDPLVVPGIKRDYAVEADKLFDSAAIKQKFPDVVLRGAFVQLLGTIGEPAMDVYMSSKVNSISFGTVPSGQGAIAQSKTRQDGSIVIVFNQALQNEKPALFTSTLAHEVLHQEDANGIPEEAIANALETLIYAQQIRDFPPLAKNPTRLTQTLNTELLARFNSGDQDKLRLFGSSNVFPGSPAQFKDFYTYSISSPAYSQVPNTSTPGNPLLTAMLAKLANPGVTQPTNPSFDDATLKFLDQNLNWAVLSPMDLVAIARQLDLAPTAPATQPPPFRLFVGGISAGR